MNRLTRERRLPKHERTARRIILRMGNGRIEKHEADLAEADQEADEGV